MITPGNLLLTTFIVALLFGTKKLRAFGEDLGAAVKNFRTSMKQDDEKVEEKETAAQPPQE